MLPFFVGLVQIIALGGIALVDLTPIAFSVSGGFIALALDKFNILDTIPYAKDAIMESIIAPIVVTDSEGYISGANDKARALFREEAELEGQVLTDLAPTLTGLVDDGGSRNWAANGADYLVDCYAVGRESRRWAGRIYFFRDITQIAHAAREREEALAKADAANAAKSALIAVVSHELRNPLNAIIGMADLDIRSGPPPELQEDFEVIRASGNVLLGLVNDLLDLSKIEAGQDGVRERRLRYRGTGLGHPPHLPPYGREKGCRPRCDDRGWHSPATSVAILCASGRCS